MAEIALGLLCSCLVILPRLYQHLASIPPYRGTSGNLGREGNTRHGRSNNTSAKDKGQWVQLQEANALPPKQSRDVKSGIENDVALGKAVDGTVGDLDLESGATEVPR